MHFDHRNISPPKISICRSHPTLSESEHWYTIVMYWIRPAFLWFSHWSFPFRFALHHLSIPVGKYWSENVVRQSYFLHSSTSPVASCGWINSSCISFLPPIVVLYFFFAVSFLIESCTLDFLLLFLFASSADVAIRQIVKNFYEFDVKISSSFFLELLLICHYRNPFFVFLLRSVWIIIIFSSFSSPLWRKLCCNFQLSWYLLTFENCVRVYVSNLLICSRWSATPDIAAKMV